MSESERQAVDLDQALRFWRRGREQDGGSSHIDDDVIYELVRDPGAFDTPAARHLAGCRSCMAIAGEFLTMRRDGRLGMDLAVRRAAAAGEADQSRRFETEAGRFVIETRPHLDDTSRAILTVTVAGGFRDQLEGHTIQLRNRHGRILAEGPIVGGELSRELSPPVEIDDRLVILID